MHHTPTNFSGFLPENPFSVIQTQHIYPGPMRENDPELDVNKAMTMLTIAEEQIFSMIQPLPFDPADFGFVEADAELQVYRHKDDPKRMIRRMDEPMTWWAYCPGEDDYGNPSFKLDFIMKFYFPNSVIAQVCLRSIGFIPMAEVIPMEQNKGPYVPPQEEESEEPLTYGEMYNIEKQRAHPGSSGKRNPDGTPYIVGTSGGPATTTGDVQA
jgi:hypothetical protein